MESKSSLLLEIKDAQDEQLTVGLLDVQLSQNFIKSNPDSVEKSLFKVGTALAM